MTDRVPNLRVVRPAEDAEQGDGVPPSGRTDDDLLLLARGGTIGAFSELVQRHQARVLRVAARQLGRNVSTAADVVQNTFFEIYRSLPRYQPRGQFRSYLFRILLNQCRMAHRTAAVQARVPAIVESCLESCLESSLPPSQEAEVLARERERDVEAALGRLSPKLRDVVLLRYSGELSYDEIAATLAVPIGTVRRRLFDATKKLREIMESR